MLLPDALEKQVQELEATIASESLWPKSGDKAEQLRNTIGQLVNQIPPWAEETLLPRLNVLHWGADALLVLNASGSSDPDKLEEQEGECRSLLEDAPKNASVQLRDRLASHLKVLDDAAGKRRREIAMRQAEKALQGEGDATAAWSKLESYETDAKVKSLRQRLRVKVLERSTDERLGLLHTTLGRVPTLGNERWKQLALSHVYDATIGLLLDLEVEEERPQTSIAKVHLLLEQCEKDTKELGQRQQNEMEKKVREYQAWALKQIQEFSTSPGWDYEQVAPRMTKELNSFNGATKDIDWVLFREFPLAKEVFKGTLGIDLSRMQGSILSPEKQKAIYDSAYARIGWKNNIDQEVAYFTTREGMIKFLLPINVNLLEPPVAQLYNKVFSKAWQKLESHGEDQFRRCGADRRHQEARNRVKQRRRGSCLQSGSRW